MEMLVSMDPYQVSCIFIYSSSLISRKARVIVLTLEHSPSKWEPVRIRSDAIVVYFGRLFLIDRHKPMDLQGVGGEWSK
jgi:hypothetical protein